MYGTVLAKSIVVDLPSESSIYRQYTYHDPPRASYNERYNIMNLCRCGSYVALHCVAFTGKKTQCSRVMNCTFSHSAVKHPQCKFSSLLGCRILCQKETSCHCTLAQQTNFSGQINRNDNAQNSHEESRIAVSC